MNKEAVIGIDTSNYTTSVAAVDSEGNILSDRRKLLEVKPGTRGLRQQEALFQHVNDLPVLIRMLMEDIGGYKIAGISCSSKPRPAEGSYMPCFNAGVSMAESLAAVLGCGVSYFSHQEGHVTAASKYTAFEDKNDFVFFHLSGGTTEAVSLPGYIICGKTLDISFGQLIDRAGVSLGIGFPCGKELDSLALTCETDDRYSLPPIKVKDGDVNLSGIETACQKMISETPQIDNSIFAASLFDRAAEALSHMTEQISKNTGKKGFLFAGGVSSSIYIRNRLGELLPEDITAEFGKPELCRDNAVGTALLGGKEIWR